MSYEITNRPKHGAIGVDTPYGLGHELAYVGLNIASAAHPVANKAFYIPISVLWDATIDRFYVINGTTASANFDIGVYGKTMTKIASTGSTGQGGATSQRQVVSVTPFVLPRGFYFLGISLNSNASHFFRWADANAVVHTGWGEREEASAFPLPATMTPAAITTSYLPICGMLETGAS